MPRTATVGSTGLVDAAINLAEAEDRVRRLKQAALTGGPYDPREYDRLLLERRRLRGRLNAPGAPQHGLRDRDARAA